MIPSQPLPDLSPELKSDPKSAIYAPLGAISPFWFLYAGAASAGVAFWWLSRWREATNLEALFAQAPVAASLELPDVVEEAAAPVESPEPVAAAEPERAFVAAAELLTGPEPAVEPAPAIEPGPIMDAAPEPEPEAAAAPKAKAARAARPIVDDPA